MKHNELQGKEICGFFNPENTEEIEMKMTTLHKDMKLILSEMQDSSWPHKAPLILQMGGGASY